MFLVISKILLQLRLWHIICHRYGKSMLTFSVYSLKPLNINFHVLYRMSLFSIKRAPIESKIQGVSDFQERNCLCTIHSLCSILLYCCYIHVLLRMKSSMSVQSCFNFYFHVSRDDRRNGIMNHILFTIATASHINHHFFLNGFSPLL